MVFHLPGAHAPVSRTDMDTRMSNEDLLVLMRLLKKYLMDDSVEIIDMASQALQVSLLK